MAYDIGQGISDAFGSIAEGMVTRKERQEERQKLIGQHETIEEDLYAEYQSLLNKGSGENVVKAAQTEYEKWSKRGDELGDESTKKIEGIISEYDKGEVRKSKRLQNRMAELQIDFANETNDYRKGKIEQDFLTAKLTNEATQQKQKDRKSLTEFISGYEGATSKQVHDTEPDWTDPMQLDQPQVGTPEFYYRRDESGRVAPAPERVKESAGSLRQRLEAAGEDLMGSVYDPASGFGVPADSERGMELLALEHNLPDDTGAGGGPANPYAGISNRNAFGLKPDPYEGYLPPVQVPEELGPQPESYYIRGSRDTMRDPTTSEQATAAQEYLSRSAGKLGPEGYAKAQAHVQSRHPRALPGARIQLDGEDTGKYIAGGQVLTERLQSAMGLSGPKQGMFLKGTTQTIDPTTGEVKTTLNYAPGQDPRKVPEAEKFAEQHSDLTFNKGSAGLAPSDQDAKDFRTMSSDADIGIQMIQEALDQDEKLSALTRRMPVTWAGGNKIRAEIKTKLNLLRGKLRLAVIGPGAVSEYEQKILLEVIGDPTKFFQFDTNSRARLKELQRIMAQGVKVRGEHLGLWDYDHKLREGEKLASDKLSFTAEDQANYDRKVKSGEGFGSNEIPPGVKFNNVQDALKAGYPAGTEVYIRDIAAGGYRPYSIPSTGAASGRVD